MKSTIQQDAEDLRIKFKAERQTIRYDDFHAHSLLFDKQYKEFNERFPTENYRSFSLDAWANDVKHYMISYPDASPEDAAMWVALDWKRDQDNFKLVLANRATKLTR